MTSRDRFARAMAHQPSDRPPLDLGATSLTGMSAACQENLRRFLGFAGTPATTHSGVDERILQWAGTDFRGVGGIVDLPGPHTRKLSPTAFVDCWGVRRERVGLYWEITHCPLRGASRADLEAFPWPQPRIEESVLSRWREQARALHAEGRYIIIAEHPVYGILELGCWMCGYEEFLIKLACEEDFVRAFFDKVLAIQLELIESYYGALGSCIDLTTSGDDFGTQGGPLVSPETFGRLIAPYFSARIARTKQLARCHYWHHSCGGIFELIGPILDCGVDILNPIQTSAAGMEPARLKAAFGDRVVFWGGVDVQGFLPKATAAEVPRHVRRLVRELGHRGGYVMAAAHNMQDDVPPENIAAWVETVRRMEQPPAAQPRRP